MNFQKIWKKNRAGDPARSYQFTLSSLEVGELFEKRIGNGDYT